jgi:hypothetical protein
MFDKIRQWANDRNFIEGSSAQAQTVKLFEEGGELGCGANYYCIPIWLDYRRMH